MIKQLPEQLLASPAIALVRRELLTGMRSKRIYVFLALVVAGAMLLVLLGWPDDAMDFNAAGTYSRAVLNIVVGLGLLVMLVLVTSLAAGAIPGEREKDTFDLLRTTLLSPGDIVLAKAVSAVALFLLVAIACLPLLATLSFLVGVDWTQLGWSALALLLGSFPVALLAIAVSARIKSGPRAIAQGYAGIIIFFCVLPYVLSIAMYAIFRVIEIMWETPPLSFYASLLACASPVRAVTFMQAGGRSLGTFLLVMGTQACVSVFLFWLALRGLRLGVKQKKADFAKPISDPKQLRQRRRTFPFYLIDPLRPKKPIKDGRNPETVKEFQWGLAKRGGSLGHVFCVALFIFAFFGFAHAFHKQRETAGILLAAQIIVAIVLSPAVVAGSLTREKELGNLDMLRLTLLTPRQIILGRLAAGFLWIIPILLAGLIWTLLPLPWTGLGHWPILVSGYATLVLCAWLALALSLVASVLARTTTAAIAVGYAFNFVAFFGMQWLVAALLPSLGLYGSNPQAHRFIRFLSPIGAWDAAFDSRSIHAGYWLANIVVFAGISSLLTLLAVALFARRYTRDA